jgi:hypothetical protein
MKSRAMFSIGLAVCLGLMLILSSAAYSQTLRPLGDTGILPIGPNQILRISGDGVDQDDVVVRIRRISYSQTGCAPGNICKHSILSQTLSAPITLAPGEAVSLDILGNQIGADVSGTRIIISSNNPKVRLNASFIDVFTNQTTSVLIALLLP